MPEDSASAEFNAARSVILRRTFKLSVYLTFAAAFITFFQAEHTRGSYAPEVLPAVYGIFFVLLFWLWRREKHPVAISPRGEYFCLFLIIGVAADFVWLNNPLPIVCNHALAAAGLFLLTLRKNIKEYFYLHLIALILVASGALLDDGWIFLPLLIYYAALGVKSLWLFRHYVESGELRRELRITGEPAWRELTPYYGRSFFVFHLLVIFLTLLVGATLFVFCPRSIAASGNAGQSSASARLHKTTVKCPIGARKNAARTGVSDRRVRLLGQISSIKQDFDTAFSVKCSQNGQPRLLSEKLLYWRGIAYDLYNPAERSWSGYDNSMQAIVDEDDGQEDGCVRLDSLWFGSGIPVTQEITLSKEMLEYHTLYFLHSPIGVGLPVIQEDPRGSLQTDDDLPVNLDAESLVPPSWEYLPVDASCPKDRNSPAVVAPALIRLAKRITEGRQTPLEQIRAVEDYLKKNYKYSLNIVEPPEDIEPIEFFLLNPKSKHKGHCELFASAMVVLLRSIDIPARLVEGFKGGRWNQKLQRYEVRFANAHAWVEVYFNGLGWYPFDPTPPLIISKDDASGDEHEGAAVGGFQGWWRQNVVRFDSRQNNIFALLGGVFREAGLLAVRNWKGASALLALALLLLWSRTVRRTRQRRISTFGGSPVEYQKVTLAFYWKMLLVLKRMGYMRAPRQTPREFALEVISAAGEGMKPMMALTEYFERVRYGAQPLSPEEEIRIKTLLDELFRIAQVQ